MAISFDAALPLLPLRKGVLLPGRTTNIPIGRPTSLALAGSLSAGDQIVIGVQLDPSISDPSLTDLHPVGVLARVTGTPRRGSATTTLSVETLERVHIDQLLERRPFWKVRAHSAEEVGSDQEAVQIRAESLRGHVLALAPKDASLRRSLLKAESPSLIADIVASWVEGPTDERIPVLLELDVEARLKLVGDFLARSVARAEIKQAVDSEVRRGFTKNQRDAVLREQLRAIKQQLGESDGDDAEPLREKLDAAELPEEVRKVVDRELGRLESMPAQHAESNVIRNYLELISDLPWNKRADAKDDLDEVSQVLEADHHGLKDVKRRILEHMAVLKLAPQARGTILCLSGPPGVGKTSLAQSIAEATGRPLGRVSLGGVRDEADVRGHRRTYVGALPGRMISALKNAGVKNPVIVLDEVDKLARGWGGDPEAALLELLDPEQNDKFTDHYLDMPFDFSEVLFIATANDLSQISAPLRDRLEIIEVAGYTTDEKVAIAKKHLMPKATKAHGLKPKSVFISDEVIHLMARDYTREAGVRKLRQQIDKVCRWVALEVARGTTEADNKRVITEVQLREILGRPRFLSEKAERGEMPGVAAGLAWTPVGGDILYIETTKMEGKGRLEITGKLGDVMQESARAALAYLRSHSSELNVEPDFLERTDLHIHVPAGAVPKDGPSAGVTIFTALASLLTGRQVRSDTAMTGEATLRGRVLPVGGIKSKVLAAHRAGFERVILPKLNGPDLEDVPQSVRDEIEFVLVEDMGEVIDAALEPASVLRESLIPPDTTSSNAA